MLGIGRHLARYGTPLIGINQGRLGFITDIALDDYQHVLQPMLHGQYEEDARSLMHARVVRNEQCVFEALAMNDVVVNRGGTSGMVELRVEVDGRFLSNQRADGLIVATPTGSTAYTLSVGGPLMHPSIPAWLMAPIAPHTLSNRPIVLSDQTEVMMEVVGGRDVSANFDMQSLASLLQLRSHLRAPLGLQRALSAPRGLELLFHAAQEAGLLETKGAIEHGAQADCTARLRHRAAARPGSARRIHRADGRDRRRQIDPDRRLAAGAG